MEPLIQLQKKGAARPFFFIFQPHHIFCDSAIYSLMRSQEA